MDIGVPEDLARWTSDDVILALLRHGEDEAGDLILGETCLRAALSARLSPADALMESERSRRYPQFAEDTLQGDIVGSSAGGEQPKFTATLSMEENHRPVIVKFSDRVETPSGRRWADLLHAEMIANEVLHAHGIAAADTTILEADGRVFLESTRFDRSPVLGRTGFIHLAAIDAAYYGHGRIRWQAFADELERDGWIDGSDAASLRMIGWFGELIANNDMHLGNAGLILCDERPLALAPVYDMLPMRFRPSANGEVVSRHYEVPPPLPEQRDDWHRAASAALEFWRHVGDDAMTSTNFRAIADGAGTKLDRAMRRF